MNKRCYNLKKKNNNKKDDDETMMHGELLMRKLIVRKGVQVQFWVEDEHKEK